MTDSMSHPGQGPQSALRSGLKKLRASQPFNYLATTAVRGVLGAAGIRSEGVIRHLHRVGTVESRLPNGRTLRLWSRGDDWVSNQVYWRSWDGYEPETVPLFFRLAQAANVTFDVGAFVGYFTLLAGHANPKGRVFAFEPLPNVYERLKENVGRNALANVRCMNLAVGDTDGEAEFYHVADGLPTSSSLSYDFMKSTEQLQRSKVEVITLDRFVRDNGIDRVDLMKIDTESTEPQVLAGMTETLRRDKPLIVCEVLGRGTERPLEELLAPLGYHFYHLTPAGPVRRERIEGHEEWLNYAFTSGDGHELGRIVGA